MKRTIFLILVLIGVGLASAQTNQIMFPNSLITGQTAMATTKDTLWLNSYHGATWVVIAKISNEALTDTLYYQTDKMSLPWKVQKLTAELEKPMGRATYIIRWLSAGTARSLLEVRTY